MMSYRETGYQVTYRDRVPSRWSLLDWKLILKRCKLILRLNRVLYYIPKKILEGKSSPNEYNSLHSLNPLSTKRKQYRKDMLIFTETTIMT